MRNRVLSESDYEKPFAERALLGSQTFSAPRSCLLERDELGEDDPSETLDSHEVVQAHSRNDSHAGGARNQSANTVRNSWCLNSSEGMASRRPSELAVMAYNLPRIKC